jgi:MinD superfamily P-loop ATPase
MAEMQRCSKCQRLCEKYIIIEPEKPEVVVCEECVMLEYNTQEYEGGTENEARLVCG